MKSNVFYFELIVQVTKQQLKQWLKPDRSLNISLISVKSGKKEQLYELTVVSFYNAEEMQDNISSGNFRGIKSFRTRSLPGNENEILRAFHSMSFLIDQVAEKIVKPDAGESPVEKEELSHDKESD